VEMSSRSFATRSWLCPYTYHTRHVSTERYPDFVRRRFAGDHQCTSESGRTGVWVKVQGLLHSYQCIDQSSLSSIFWIGYRTPLQLGVGHTPFTRVVYEAYTFHLLLSRSADSSKLYHPGQVRLTASVQLLGHDACN
jgi:hypothetical protein